MTNPSSELLFQFTVTPVLEFVEELAEIPKVVAQDHVQQTIEQLMDVPVPQVLEEPLEVPNISSLERAREFVVEPEITSERSGIFRVAPKTGRTLR